MKNSALKMATKGLAGAMALAGGSQAYGAVVSVAVPANLTNTAGSATFVTSNWDVNGDGTADFQFQDRYPNTDPTAGTGVVWQLRMNPATTALAATNNVIGYGASSTFKYANALASGGLINGSRTFTGGATTLILGSQYAYGGYATNYGGFAAGPNASTGAVAPGTNAYAGFRFASGGNTYYGWIQLSVNAGTLNFVNAAYNNTPGQGLLAGTLTAVPEPGTMAAMALGAAAVLGTVVKRRRAKSVA